MSQSHGMVQFHNYANSIIGNRMPESEIFNGHTTFLMCNRNNREDIRTHRMNWLVTNYITYDCEDDVKKDLKDVRDVYKDYYKTNLIDSYSGRFDPPRCFYNHASKLDDMDRRKYLQECEERYNDDIDTHYRDISKRFDVIHPIDTVLSEEEIEEIYESDGNDIEYVTTQPDGVEDYDDNEFYEEYHEETEIEDDYHDW